MKNRVTWFEIIGKDAGALHKFYGEVFGWKLTPPVAEMGNYSMLAEQGPTDKGAGGGIGGDPNDGARVSIYIEVDDPQRYLDRAQRAGATILMPATQITPDTMIGMFRDPAGNTNGVLKANPERPEPERAARKAGASGRTTTARKKTTTRRKSTSSGSSRKKTTTRRTRRR